MMDTQPEYRPYVDSDFLRERELDAQTVANRERYADAWASNSDLAKWVDECIPCCRADACGQDPRRCPCPEACVININDTPRAVRWAARFIAWLRS